MPTTNDPAHLQTIFDLAPVGIGNVGPDGRYVRVNRALCQLFGRSADDLCGRTVAELTHPDDRAASDARFAALVAGERDTFSTEKRYLRPDGTTVWTRITVAAIRTDSGALDYTVSLVEDITDRKAAEDELHASEDRFRTLFEQSPYGIALYGPDGWLRQGNRAFYDLIGLRSPKPGAKYQPRHNLLRDPRLREAGHQRLVRHAFAGQVVTLPPVRYDARTPGGQDRWVGASIYPLRDDASRLREIAVIYDDASERMSAYELLEARVAERTRELTTLLDVSHTVASTLDLQPLLDLILDQLRAVVAYTSATIYVAEGEDTIALAYQGPFPREMVLGMRVSLAEIEQVWPMVYAGQPLIIGDLQALPEQIELVRTSFGDRAERFLSYAHARMYVPMLVQDRFIGLLSLTHQESGHYALPQGRLALAFGQQAAIAIENARLYTRAQEFAVLEERQRLARELHDSVSQALYGIALGARTARTLLDRDHTKVAQPLDYVLSLAEAGLTEMRALIFELRPESLATEGLCAAFAKVADALRARHRLAVELDLAEEPTISLPLKEALYRIAQEATNNTVKHARATQVTIRLTQDAAACHLAIRDDGVGFDPRADFAGHFGLTSMRERATRLGGILRIDSTPGVGTTVAVRVPVSA